MEHDNNTWHFEGFHSPNFTSVPDEFFDYVAPRLNGGEVKLALYMIRRTYGFKKESDNISISQMLSGIVRRDGSRLDWGAGLSKTTLLDSLKRLEEKNIIYRIQQWDIRGGCVATNYRLNVKGNTPGIKTDQGGAGLKNDQGQVGNYTNPLVQKPTTQYTVNNKQLDNNVNVSNKTGRKRNVLHDLEDKQKDSDHVRLIAEDILAVLGDRRSEQFYRLVARKVPETLIRRTLSELKEGGARNPAKIFTNKMMEYATHEQDTQQQIDIAKERQNLAHHFKAL